MVKAVARCPCGHNVLHLAVRRGEAPPALPCNKDCERLARRTQLAAAFGVEDPDGTAPFFDRHRTPTYSPALLAAAKKDPLFFEGLEAEWGAFLADPARQRLVLAPMPHKQRALVHEYAEEGWGFTSSSNGQEPQRAVTLFKAPATGEQHMVVFVCWGVGGLVGLAA